MPLHAQDKGKGCGVRPADALDQSVRSHSPGVPAFGKAVDALVMVADNGCRRAHRKRDARWSNAVRYENIMGCVTCAGRMGSGGSAAVAKNTSIRKVRMQRSARVDVEILKSSANAQTGRGARPNEVGELSLHRIPPRIDRAASQRVIGLLITPRMNVTATSKHDAVCLIKHRCQGC